MSKPGQSIGLIKQPKTQNKEEAQGSISTIHPLHMFTFNGSTLIHVFYIFFVGFFILFYIIFYLFFDNNVMHYTCINEINFFFGLNLLNLKKQIVIS